MINPFSGHSITIWQVKTCSGGFPANSAAARNYILVKMDQIKAVSVDIKVIDDSVDYNLTPLPNNKWNDDIMPALTDELKKAGHPLIGWGYVYLRDPEGEAKKAAERILELKLDGFAIDAEGEAKKAKQGFATRYITTLRSMVPDIPLALNTYRYPSLHPEFPWMEFLNHMDAARGDVHMPQVYWLGDEHPNAPADQLTRSFEELKKLKDLPVVPEGSVWATKVAGAPWSTTAEQIKIFARTAWKLGCPGLSYWAWDQIQKKGFNSDWWSAIEWVGANWPISTPPTPQPDQRWDKSITAWARRQPDPYIGPDPE